MVEGVPQVGVEMDRGGQVLHGRRPLALLGVGASSVQPGGGTEGVNSKQLGEVVDSVRPVPEVAVW